MQRMHSSAFLLHRGVISTRKNCLCFLKRFHLISTSSFPHIIVGEQPITFTMQAGFILSCCHKLLGLAGFLLLCCLQLSFQVSFEAHLVCESFGICSTCSCRITHELFIFFLCVLFSCLSLCDFLI